MKKNANNGIIRKAIFEYCLVEIIESLPLGGAVSGFLFIIIF